MRRDALCNSTVRMLASGIFGMLACIGGAGAAMAQDFPSRPLRFIVPFPPGSAPDYIARIVGQHMQQTLGQNIVVDNRPGAQGLIGAGEAMKSTPDGYTLFVGSTTTMAANLSLFKKLPYDPVKDFTPVARFITSPLMLVVRADFPARNLSEFLAYARTRQGQLSSGYAAAGMQVALAELKTRGGIGVLEVPYKGVPQAVTDVLAGQITFTFADSAVAVTQAQGGKVRVLAVTGKTRTTLMPDIPAMAEEIPGFDVSIWNGLFVRTGTPREIVVKLHDANNKAVTSSDVSARLIALGQEPGPMTIEEFRVFQVAEIKKWATQIKQAGIQPE